MKFGKACAMALLVGGTETAVAGVPVGTILEAANLDSLAQEEFEGHRVRDLLTETQELQIRKYGMKMRLARTKPIIVSPDIIAATEKNASSVRFDPATGKVGGFVSGLPFPDISDADPHKALKLMWNQFWLAPGVGDSQQASTNIGFTINADTGVDRTFEIRPNKIRMDGRWSGGPAALGDGTLHKIQADVFVGPRDLAGLGTYQQSYNDGRLDDIWAYVKSARRVRRLSGGAWMDPIGVFDILNDDNWIINAYPLWYTEYRYVGKRYILANVHQPAVPGKDPKLRWDLETPPHWNPRNFVVEPRQVHVIEAIPPKEHPYSRKVVYMEADPYFPHFYLGDFYDRKNELWRIANQGFGEMQMGDCKPGFFTTSLLYVDVQRDRGTFVDINPDPAVYVLNNPTLRPEHFRPEMLKEAAEGRMTELGASARKSCASEPVQ
jgi:hypothetical protein